MRLSYKERFVFSQPLCLLVGGRSVLIRTCGGRNCSRRATVRLGIDTLIANILVSTGFASWQHYCTILQQWASGKLRGVEQRAPPSLYSAGRPSLWASAHILVSFVGFVARMLYTYELRWILINLTRWLYCVECPHFVSKRSAICATV